MTAASVKIRPARPDEAPELTEIAVASKAHWGYDQAFMARARDLLAIEPEYIAAHEVWVAVEDIAPLGFYALLIDGDTAVLDHLWLVPSAIGHGLGRMLFEHAAQGARANRSVRLEWEAEPNAVGFYRRMGATRDRIAVNELGRELEVYRLELARSSRPSLESAGGSGTGAPRH